MEKLLGQKCGASRYADVKNGTVVLEAAHRALHHMVGLNVVGGDPRADFEGSKERDSEFFLPSLLRPTTEAQRISPTARQWEGCTWGQGMCSRLTVPVRQLGKDNVTVDSVISDTAPRTLEPGVKNLYFKDSTTFGPACVLSSSPMALRV